MRRPGRRVVAIAVAASLVPALAACGGIPTSGPVIQGRALDDARIVDRSVLVRGPEPGASPQEIVQGFLQSQAGFVDNHQVARLYLVDGQRWRPDAAVTVYPEASLSIEVQAARPPAGPSPSQSPSPSPSPSPSASGNGASAGAEPDVDADADAATVIVSAPMVATVDVSGVYRAAGPGRRWVQTLTLERVNGQWRISSPTDGIAVSEAVFQFAYSQFPLYFPDRSGSFLVPDLRWFPITTGTTTRLVRALLAGPSPWLAPAVVSAAPNNTRLTAALVADDVATIDLTPDVLVATPLQQSYLTTSLRATLARVPGISRIRLTVRQAEFAVAVSAGSSVGVGDTRQELRVAPSPDPRPLVMDDAGRVARVVGRQVRAVEGLESVDVPGAVAPGSDSTGSVFTVLAAQRSRVLTAAPGARQAETLITGSDLTAPSTDPRRWVWTTSSSGANRSGRTVVIAAHPGEPPIEMDAAWLDGLRVLSARVSRDGARLLVSATGRGRAFLLVSSIVRSSTGIPLRLGEAEDLLPDLTSVVDAAWADQVHVVVIGTRAGGARAQPSPWSVLVGGPALALPGLQAGRSIAASSEDDVWVATADGRVWESAGRVWLPVGLGSWVAMSG